MSESLHPDQITLIEARREVKRFEEQLRVRCSVVVSTRDKLWLQSLKQDVEALERACSKAGLSIDNLPE